MHPGTENDTRKGNNGNGKKKIIIKKKTIGSGISIISSH
jgi:hypothetical protein